MTFDASQNPFPQYWQFTGLLPPLASMNLVCGGNKNWTYRAYFGVAVGR
jgi:hypothetical protein